MYSSLLCQCNLIKHIHAAERSQEFNIYNYFYLLFKAEIILHAGLQLNALFLPYSSIYLVELCAEFDSTPVFLQIKCFQKMWPSHLKGGWLNIIQWFSCHI